MTDALLHRQSATLVPDPGRVVARLFLPGEELHQNRSRTGQIVDRVMDLPEDEVVDLVRTIQRDFAGRHHHYEHLLARHASIVVPHVAEDLTVTAARRLLLGATFTAEYATEAAALCNPSAVEHPDQSGLAPGQLRVAISLRGIGEGHISSIGFCAAVIDPVTGWTFETRRVPAAEGVAGPARWTIRDLAAILGDQGHIDELGSAVLHQLPTEFSGVDLEEVLADLARDLLTRPTAAATVGLLRRLVSSAYSVEFDEDLGLDQRVLLPTAAEESNGMEDARFTRFVDDDGVVDFRATYTAYDGRNVAPRLLTSPDLRSFLTHRLAGPAARNKGMALFPRRVGGRHLALCRSDGETTGVSSSEHGHIWESPTIIQRPSEAWELLQIGNCGPPLETDRGWLVLTHGVGPMRTYSIGAVLLDLDDPTRVVGQLRRPLLEPGESERDGYVPNVVYSCGSFLHDGTVWVPYGIDDARIGVACGQVEEILDAMVQPATSSA